MFFFFFYLSLFHTGYTEGLEARYGACHAAKRDKRQTNIWVAPSNPDQSVCQEPDKLTGMEGTQEVERVGYGCGDVRLSALEGVFPLWTLIAH